MADVEAGRSNGDGITLRGLRKTYRSPGGPVEAVRDVNAHVEVGELVALLGPNGAGKSTTVDMLLGLQEPDDGSVDVFGGPPRRAVVAGRIGAMLQGGGVLDLTMRSSWRCGRALSAPLDVDRHCSWPGWTKLARPPGTTGGGNRKQLRSRSRC